MNFVFLMDPLETVNIEKDTSFAFMLGAVRAGHTVHYLPNHGIHLAEAGVSLDVTPVTPQRVPHQPFICDTPTQIEGDVVDAVFIRTDPPFDKQYLMNTLMLEQLPDHVVVMNSPAGIRAVNEKVWAVQFRDLLPPSLITNDEGRFLKFLEHHRRIVAKPTDGFGGQGVFIISHGDTNAGVIFETLTAGRHQIVVQQYVPEAEIGDKRILLLNGDPLGAVLRVHGEDDHRNNFFAGGKPVAAEITPRDREIIDVLTPHLISHGLSFVGIDVMGDYLIEVNVTSPTCLQEMNGLYDQQLEDEVIAFVEKQVIAKTRS